jgi:hypothetical protein
MTATTGTLFDDPPSQQPAHSPRSSTVPPPAAWPTPPDPAANHGLLGEIVRALEPETEADPFAILTQLLVAFGTAVGRRANFQIEATPHHPHEFLLLVGSSASNLRSVIPASWAAGSRNAHTKPSPLLRPVRIRSESVGPPRTSPVWRDPRTCPFSLALATTPPGIAGALLA